MRKSYPKGFDFEELDTSKIVQTFGKPPYEFLNYNGDQNIERIARIMPEKVIHNNRLLNTRLSQDKAARNPGPNWYHMDSQLVSKNADFQLQLAPEGFQNERVSGYDNDEGSNATSVFNNILNYNANESNGKKQYNVPKAAFWIKAKRSKNFLKKPQPGDTLDLMTMQNQIKCTATIDKCYIEGNRRSGYVVLRDFRAIGQVKNPKEYATPKN